jgi:hypothetical protein
MTLPVSGPISLNAVNVELQQSGTTTISMNQTNVRTLAGVPSGKISMSDLYGKAYTVPGNSGIITSGTSYTLPSTCGLTIKVLAIAGGGGGGGGSGRTSYSGYFTGGGGGGAGGNSYAVVSVTPGQTISYNVGNGGSAGVTRDGIYSSGSDGGSGTYAQIIVNGTTVAYATGGSGGAVSPNATGGAAGSNNGFGSVLLTPQAGGTAGSETTYGGTGAPGYNINTTIGATTILTYGSPGVTYPQGSSNYNVAGTGYGAGGSGGSTVQSDVYNPNPDHATTGYSGSTYAVPTFVGSAIFIWWGY